jgi:CRP-like cAMP-binding protein
MEAFFSFISQITRLNEDSISALSQVLQRLELPKGYQLLRPGAVCHHFYFIEKGLTRTWYIKNGKDVTDWLSPENSIAVSVLSFLTREPDVRGIELLEPSVLWAVSRTDLDNLYAQYHDIERMGRLLVSSGIIQVQQRFDDLHFATAQERYNKLINTHPTFINRVPLGMIASYLGITQETLSRIRSHRSTS